MYPYNKEGKKRFTASAFWSLKKCNASTNLMFCWMWPLSVRPQYIELSELKIIFQSTVSNIVFDSIWLFTLKIVGIKTNDRRELIECIYWMEATHHSKQLTKWHLLDLVYYYGWASCLMLILDLEHKRRQAICSVQKDIYRILYVSFILHMLYLYWICDAFHDTTSKVYPLH